MSQITVGIRSILSQPIVYDSLQNLMGLPAFRERLVREYVRPHPGMKILDVGCGTAAILNHLPEINYWGFDISQPYIRDAKKKFGDRGHFICKVLEKADLDVLPKFDRVLALGVLHHLDDSEARTLVSVAHEALAPDGLFISADACYVDGQNPIARFLIARDRDQNVRHESGYNDLISPWFTNRTSTIQHQSWIPYTCCIMTGSR